MKSRITSLDIFNEKMQYMLHIIKSITLVKKINNFFGNLIQRSNKLYLKREILYLLSLIFIFKKISVNQMKLDNYDLDNDDLDNDDLDNDDLDNDDLDNDDLDNDDLDNDDLDNDNKKYNTLNLFKTLLSIYIGFKIFTKGIMLLISLLIKCIQFINSIIQFIIKICKIISKYIIFSYKKTYITQI